jgi:hypothetical protein
MTECLERKMVSEDGFDLCVRCSEKTEYPTRTPVDKRYNYVDGSGQLCTSCYSKTFGLGEKQ